MSHIVSSGYLDRVNTKTLGQLLQDHGFITAEQCEQGLGHARATGSRLGEALVELGLAKPEEIAYVLGEQFGVKPIELHPGMVDATLVARFPMPLLEKYRMVPLVVDGDALVVAVSDPNDGEALQALAAHAPECRMVPQIADPRQIRVCLDSPAVRRAVGRSAAPAPEPLPEPVASTPDGSSPDFMHWLVTVVLQDPTADTAIRCAGTEAVVVQAGRELHRFRATSLPAIRSALWRQCRPLSATSHEVGAWATPLQFSGRHFVLQLHMMDDLLGSTIRLRPLEMLPVPLGRSQAAWAAADAPLMVLAYVRIDRLEDALVSLVAAQPDPTSVLLLQSVVRAVPAAATVMPAGLVNPVVAAAAVQARTVVWDHPATAGVAALTALECPHPNAVVCAPIRPPAGGAGPGLPAQVYKLVADHAIPVAVAGPDEVRTMPSDEALHHFTPVNG